MKNIFLLCYNIFECVNIFLKKLLIKLKLSREKLGFKKQFFIWKLEGCEKDFIKWIIFIC